MQHIASISYGKDSLAMLEVITQNGLPLDRIIHCEVWATPTIQADLPPMVEFKDKADRIILERYGIEVERVRAKRSYEEQFYLVKKRGSRAGERYGWPFMLCAWCNGVLKGEPLNKIGRNAIQYIGIACDEPSRYHNITETKRAPLVEYHITEEWCRQWCEENDLLSPIYTTATRGGCWFCHNQSVNQLRLLRKNYPDLWATMLRWDEDAPHEFKIDITLPELETRFMWEDRQVTFNDLCTR
jgi:3'-phosphoadenosine 5'-phosphosulfate sulfotransferase (PAPS reductase)/FAD synthetase